MHPLLRYTRIRAGLAARHDRSPRAAGVAEHQQGRGRSLRRRARARLAAIGGNVERLRRTERGDHLRASSPATGPQLWSSATSTRCGMSARSSGCRFARKTDALRPGHLRHEGRHRDVDARGARLRRRCACRGRAIVMLWTTDEEIGSATSRTTIEEEARRSAARAGARALAARRRGEDQPQGVRRVRAHRARRLGARRHRSWRGRERGPRAGPSDRRAAAAAGPRPRSSASTSGVVAAGPGRT